nr:33K protein [Lemur mastadenovirus]WGN96538.1 33K protein [Lemur mastadenovirus]
MAHRNQIMRQEEEDSMSESGYVTGEESADDSLPSPRTPSPLPAGSRLTDSMPPASPRKPRWDQVRSRPARKRQKASVTHGQDSYSTKELRDRIFPTLYAIFQQSRGSSRELKIKNRSFRSLTRSCLYHKTEAQLQKTLEDAESLFEKYCAQYHS